MKTVASSCEMAFIAADMFFIYVGRSAGFGNGRACLDVLVDFLLTRKKCLF